MKHYFPRLLILGLAVGVSASALAQSPSPFIFTARPKYTFSAGLKIRSGGSKVSFGQLGSVSRSLVNSDGTAVFYDDGSVGADGKRTEETASTTEFYNNGTRYRTYTISTNSDTGVETKTQTGDGLAFQEGQTRRWSYNNASQVSGDFIEMHAIVAATSDGGSAEGDSNGSAGFDLQLARDLGTIGKKGSWGVALSFGLNEINSKAAGSVTSTLHSVTDRYSLNGQPAPTAADGTLPYAAPFFGDGPAADGTTLTGTYERTTPLSQFPVGDSIETVTPGGATVEGRWQIKAAYYMIRLGPSFRYQFLRRLSLSGSAGLATAYWGSTYFSDERIVAPIEATVFTHEEKKKSGVLLGYFGELNAEFWITYQTGFFLGIVYENLGDFSQTLGGRTAHVDVGSGLGVRVGIITRF